MSMHDPIADMLTRIRNAQVVGHTEVSMPASQLKSAIARVLKDEGYIDDFGTRENGAKKELAIALNYGSRAELVRAARAAAAGGEIDEASIEQALDTHDLPPLDLLIRTSGEQRLSNFLLWQAAYAELLFVDTLWPDFDGDALRAALSDYARRERRYGGL